MNDYWKISIWKPNGIGNLDRWVLEFRGPSNSEGPIRYEVIDEWVTLYLDPSDIKKDPGLYSWLWGYIKNQGLSGFQGFYGDTVYNIDLTVGYRLTIFYKDIKFAVSSKDFTPFFECIDSSLEGQVETVQGFGPINSAWLIGHTDIPKFIDEYKKEFLGD